VTLMIGHVERFNPAVAAIKQAISGEDILSIGITASGRFHRGCRMSASSSISPSTTSI
jgi:predicted dehydrogenase